MHQPVAEQIVSEAELEDAADEYDVLLHQMLYHAMRHAVLGEAVTAAMAYAAEGMTPRDAIVSAMEDLGLPTVRLH